MRLHDHLEYWARVQPQAEFARLGAQRFDYAGAAQRVARMAGALARAGLAPGERVAILARNCLDYSLFYLAASKAGVVPVPLNYRLAPPEWQFILENSGASWILAQPEYCDAIDGLRAALPALRGSVSMGEARPGWQAFERWLDVEPMSVRESNERAWPELYQMYTSGTTGRPKGVLMSQDAMLALLMQCRAGYKLERGGCVLVVMPMYHVAGALWTGFAACTGAGIYMMADFDAAEAVRAMDEERITFAMLVPAMIQACLTQVPDVAKRRYADLEMMGYGAAPIAEATLRRALETFRCEFVQAFGMTEAPNLVYLTHADHQRALEGQPELLLSTGRAGPGSEVKIVDENDRELPPGEIGEICGRGPQIMTGYWKLPEASAEALRGGWMHTGDAGCLDAEGFLYIKDRVKDMILSGGENIYPREVEDVLFSHPSVADAAVIGVPSERWGEEVKAIVVLRAGASASPDELMDWCKGRIAAYKRPRSVDFIDVLPRNASGKVLKRELREPYWKGRERRVS
jgi:acyl-CoA synthetase (AMP-forming)/AMP-acid ligase II